MWKQTPIRRVLPFAVLGVLAACDRGASPASAAKSAGVGGTPPAARASSVRTNARPADACGWISAAEVSAIVGPLTGSPHPGDQGCVYPLPVDSATGRRRVQALEFQRKLEERFGKSDLPEVKPDESGVIVDVQVYADPAGERGVAAAGAIMAGWLKDDNDSGTKPAANAAPPPPTLPGWDATNRPAVRSFFGRLGHMRVGVTVQAAEVTREQTVAIANRIREKIDDLPFPSGRSGAAASPDPCVLVTVQEAEAVLGKLVVPPYRSDEGTPLAMENGTSCSYFTAGHHALVVTPTWEYGGSAYEATRGVGGMLERIAPSLHNDAADTLDVGPWEEAGGNPSTGQLYFLKGDRFLELGYLASSTDVDGAVRLARIAVERLSTCGPGACGDRAAGETQAAGASASGPARSAPATCPSVEQVTEAAGFPVTFTQSIGRGPDTWMVCQYEMTDRYRGNFLELIGQPASRADSVFGELKQRARAMHGEDAAPDRVDLGTGGWAVGSNSFSEAAAVVGSHVYHVRLEHMLVTSIGDQKDAMVRVLRLFAR